MDQISRIVGALALLALLVASWLSTVLARADEAFRRDTPESVARAVRLAPGNTEYLSLRALQFDYEGADSAPLLARIATLNPLSSAPRIRLGLAAEIRGDFAAAERWLLDAAHVDHQFEPRWTLANFYFRRDNADEFWKWIKLALEVSYGDRKPAFDLCWRMSSDPQVILDRAIPSRHDLIAAYFLYLRDNRHDDSAVPVAERLAALHDPADEDLIYAACSAFLRENRSGPAQRLWQALGNTPAAGVMNGDFAHSPKLCFDWQLPDHPGLRHLILETPSRIRIAMSGQQEETSRLLDQIVAVGGNRRATLRWETRTQGISSPSGLDWWIGDSAVATIRPSEDWQPGQAAFDASSDLVNLGLVCKRPPGQARSEGFIEVRRVSIAASGK